MFLTTLRPNLGFGGFISVSSLQKYAWKKVLQTLISFPSQMLLQTVSISQASFTIRFTQFHVAQWLGVIWFALQVAEFIKHRKWAPHFTPWSTFSIFLHSLSSSPQNKVSAPNFRPEDEFDDDRPKILWIMLTDSILGVFSVCLCRWRRRSASPACMTSTPPGWSESHLSRVKL